MGAKNFTHFTTSNFNLLAIAKRKRGRFFQSNDGERRAKTGGTKILLASSYVET